MRRSIVKASGVSEARYLQLKQRESAGNTVLCHMSAGHQTLGQGVMVGYRR